MGCLLASPKEYPVPQPVRLHQVFHKSYLVKADFKEKPGKLNQCFFT